MRSCNQDNTQLNRLGLLYMCYSLPLRSCDLPTQSNPYDCCVHPRRRTWQQQRDNWHIGSSRVGNAVAIDLLHKEVHATHARGRDVELGIGHADVDVLERAHEIVYQSLAIVADHVDHAVRWGGAVVDGHLGRIICLVHILEAALHPASVSKSLPIPLVLMQQTPCWLWL